MDKVRIRRIALDFILGVSRNLYPREFAGLLRAEDGMITEILVIPNSTWGEGFAQIGFHHVPHDHSIIGSVHSHPTGNVRPSRHDLVFFGKSGSTHIICGYPFKDISDLSCYKTNGEILDIEVVDE